ncbi:Zeta-crystallin [Dactylella cylindrospora]|nr:Zeta-crystallin [Dactylella cylindrospora]
MMKALSIEKVEGKPGQVYYPLKLVNLPKPTIQPGEVLVKILAAALNHREVFIRQHLYPGINFETPLGADGVGVVVEASSPELEKQWKGKRVIITPGRGWESSEEGPEGKYAIVGGTVGVSHGTLQEYVALSATELEESPAGLSIPEAAALPLAGLTAFRATFTKARVKAGQNVLITGIGGGVALFALQFAVAAGATVFVTSGSDEKIARAKELGAKEGVNYKREDWSKQLKGLLPKNRP